MFDSAHVEIDPETQAPVSSTNPVLGVRLSDLPNERTPATASGCAANSIASATCSLMVLPGR
ncbi:hypothetical protein ACE0DR_06040 [Azotobacter sp. CWF10]